MNNDQSNNARKLCYWAAILFLLANLTGILLIGINAGINMGNKQQMFNSHLNGLIGSFWLLGLAFSLQWVRLSVQTLFRVFTMQILVAIVAKPQA